MKTIQVQAVVTGTMLWAGVVFGQGSETNFLFNVNQAVPDGSPLGLSLTENLMGLGDKITNVKVGLDISGGYNGDLYAYLAGPNGGFAVLLNRVGVSNNATAFGYSDSGFNVTFSDSAAYTIQYYQNETSPAGGQLAGTWQPEGVTVDPLTSNPAAFFGAPQSAMLGSLDNTDPNGVWRLYLADLSSGGQATLVSFNLDIMTVPEPTTLALTGMGLAGAFVLFQRRSKVK